MAKAQADMAPAASAESDDDSGETEPASGGDPKSAGRKAQRESDSGKDAVGSSKPGPVETDLPAEDASADSKASDSAKPATGNGVRLRRER